MLFTCSAFGPAIEAVARRLPVPVLKPNEAMFEAAMHRGRRIGMLATFPPSVPTMEAEFRDERARSFSDATLKTILVADALDALKRGDAATHDRLVAAARAGARRLRRPDARALLDLARRRRACAPGVACPVLTSPDAAVAKLRGLLEPTRVPQDA